MDIVSKLQDLWFRHLRTDEFEGIDPLNKDEDWQKATKDTVLFHWLLKKPLRYAAKSIKVPGSWLNQLTGNQRVLYEIIRDEYFDREKQAWRRDTLKPLFEYGLCLYGFDNNYTEVLDYLLHLVIENREKFVFDRNQINPDNWYQDGRGRIEFDQNRRFNILSQTETHLVSDQPINSCVVSVVGKDGLNGLHYVALDLVKFEVPYPGIYVYPILARGLTVLEVAPALIKKEKEAVAE